MLRGAQDILRALYCLVCLLHSFIALAHDTIGVKGHMVKTDRRVVTRLKCFIFEGRLVVQLLLLPHTVDQLRVKVCRVCVLAHIVIGHHEHLRWAILKLCLFIYAFDIFCAERLKCNFRFSLS